MARRWAILWVACLTAFELALSGSCLGADPDIIIDSTGVVAAPPVGNGVGGASPAKSGQAVSSTPIPAPVGSKQAPSAQSASALAPAAQPARPAAAKPAMLYGRIEEIISRPGAKLPPLKAMVPRLDNSQPLKGAASSITGAISSSSSRPSDPFPMDWRGIWGGNLKVYTAAFDPICWQFDAAEANKEREILRPGLTGSVEFSFSQQGNKLALDPAQVIFSVRNANNNNAIADQLSQLFGQSGVEIDPQTRAALSSLGNLPNIYAIHLGDLVQGVGVTGNTLNSRVLKNDVRQLAPGIIEEDVVNYNADRSRNGRVRYDYSETVVRFYKQNSNALYVQAASVSYLADGRFKNKVILVGTVYRGQRAPGIADMLNNPLLKGLPLGQ